MTIQTHRDTAGRPFLRLLSAFAAAAVLAAAGAGWRIAQAQSNPIVIENDQTGDTDWDVSGAGDATIQGFASDISVNKGQPIAFKIKTDSVSYTIDIYRLGYYRDAGARKITATPLLPSATLPQAQPACATEPATGLVDCGNWAVSATWTVPASAVSGVYLAKLTRFDGGGGSSHIVFVVRDDARQADVVVQTSDTTWQAYNRYGGGSLYCGGPISNAGSAYFNSCATRSAKVSYNRPIDTRDHDATSFIFNAEYPMLRWLEANGYDVKYISGVDTDRRAGDLVGAKKPKVFMSSGHDEYWSGAQRASVEAARNAGVSLAFFSGNEMYWKTRYEPSIDGSSTAYRTLVSYKETLASAKIDPAVDGSGTPIWTGTWRDPRFSPPGDGGRPENGIIGQIWTVNSGSTAITVPASMAGMRLWRDTRVAALTSGVATLSPESLGYEWDEDLDNGARPTGLIHLSSTTVAGVEKIIDFGSTVGIGTATHNLTLYRHNSGALVFGAGTVQWAWGLDGSHDMGSPLAHVPDHAMQQATVNLLADMGAQPGSLQVGAEPGRPLVAASASADMFAPTSTITSPAAGAQVESGNRVTISGTATENGAGVVASVEVSVDGGTTWRVAEGKATWSFDWSPGVVGTATIKSRAVDDTGNLESAGPGTTVSVIVGACPCPSLWKSSTVPTNPSASDGSPYELGVKFKSDIDGFITGIRFYKGPTNSGTHLGNLWSSAGTLLATAVFSNETSSGWQQVSFGTPVAIVANTVYVASYHTNVGGYSFDATYFTNTGVNSPPLHALPSATSGGNGVFSPGGTAFPSSTFNGNNYWVDVVFAPSLVDGNAPTISAIKSATIDSSRVTVTWATDESATTRIDYGTNPAILTATLATLPAGTVTRTGSSFVTQHTMALTGLQPNTTYFYLLTAIDQSGNTTTVAAPTFTVPGPTLRDTASTDFAAGTLAGTYVSQTLDGEVILKPTAGSEFTGPSLPSGWIVTPWSPDGYSAIQDGILLVDGARVATCVTDANGACIPGENTVETPSAVFTAPHSLEFSARFSGDQYQHAGLAVTFGSASEPWAIFSTLSGGLLFARTNTGAGSIDTGLGTGLLGAFHRYRIDWKPASVDYYVDGALVASHALTVAGPMRPVAASDYNPFGGNVFVDWMRMSAYASPGSFESRVFDATTAVNWNSVQWRTVRPAGTTLAIGVRTGNTPVPDATWTAFIPVLAPGPLTLNSQYIQYRVDLTSADPDQSAALEDIIISTGHAPVAYPDLASVPQNGTHTFAASGPGSLTDNDIDADNASSMLRVVAVTPPAHGAAVVNGDGSVTYTPSADYNGPDGFTYTVSDGMLTGSAAVTLDVRFGNIAPVANNDFYTVNEDTSLTVQVAAGILANDTDVEQDPLTAILVTLPARGMLTLSANGAFIYTPNLNYAGPDVFTYRVNDGTDNGNIATVQILMNQVNDAPITEADGFTAVLNTVTLNRPLDVPAPGVLRNDHDVEVEDTAPMHVELVTGPSRGQLSLRTDGSFSYTPDADFLGTDSFTYRAIDHFNANGNVNTVTLTVATKAVSEVVLGGATVSTGAGVSAADPLQSAVTSPANATVAIAQGVISASQPPSGYTFLNQQVNITVTSADGTEVTALASNPIKMVFTIDRSLIPAGQDHMSFQMFRNAVLIPNCLGATTIPAANLDPCVSAREDLNPAVRLTILTSHASRWNMGLSTESLGDAPVAHNDGEHAVDFGMARVVPAPGVLGNDYGKNTLTAMLSGTPVGGTVNLALSGGFTFTPSPGRCGPASFKYTANDGVVESQDGTVSLRIDCTPQAGQDATTVLEDSGASAITVLSNDTDPDPAQTLAVIGVTQGTSGTVAIAANGMAVSYAPRLNFFGTDSFTYTVSDGYNGTATATVTVTVISVNDAPAFTKGADQALFEDTGAQSVTGWASGISAGPEDESGQTLSFRLVADNPALFSVQPAIGPGGTLTYDPAPNANGVATVTVTLGDSGGTANGGVDTSAPQAFAITLNLVNDAPTFTTGANQTVLEDGGARSVTGWASNISAGPSDEAGQTLNFLVSTSNSALFSAQPAIAANGVLTFTPAANASGTATVTVQLHDNGGTANGGVDTGVAQTFTIAVTPVNDAPGFVKGADRSVYGNPGAQTVANWASAITKGPADEAAQTVAFIVTSSNTALFSVQPAVASNGTLTFTPAANVNGSAMVTVTLKDNGGIANGGVDTSAAQTFAINVNKALTATALSTSNTPSLFGVPITLTAGVAVLAPGVGTAMGTVTFQDGSTALGTVALVGGAATFKTSSLAVGIHSLKAVYNPAGNFLGSASASLPETISPSAVLQVAFNVHAIMDGTNRPRVQDTPVPGAEVRVYTRRDVCTNGVVVATGAKKWGAVFDGLDGPGGTDPGCPVVSYGSYKAVGTTAANGTVSIIVPPTTIDPNTDYVVIGRTTSFDYIRTAAPVDPLYSEKRISNIKAGVAKKVLLHQIATFHGKLIPGKDLEEFGSYLAIVEPEYVDWTEDQELYPIVLVAEGDWSITTSVTPPEGFVAEESVLSTAVMDTTSAIQFTIVDIGSDWTSTKVSHSILHKGKLKKRDSAIPMFNHKKPKAHKDKASMVLGTGALLIPVLENDLTRSLIGLTLASLTQPIDGTAVMSADGSSVVFTPGAGFTGTSTFTYTAVDATGRLSTADVKVAVIPVAPGDDFRGTASPHGDDAAAPPVVSEGGPTEEPRPLDATLALGTAPRRRADPVLVASHDAIFALSGRQRRRGRRRGWPETRTA